MYAFGKEIYRDLKVYETKAELVSVIEIMRLKCSISVKKRRKLWQRVCSWRKRRASRTLRRTKKR